MFLVKIFMALHLERTSGEYIVALKGKLSFAHGSDLLLFSSNDVIDRSKAAELHATVNKQPSVE